MRQPFDLLPHGEQHGDGLYAHGEQRGVDVLVHGEQQGEELLAAARDGYDLLAGGAYRAQRELMSPR